MVQNLEVISGLRTYALHDHLYVTLLGVLYIRLSKIKFPSVKSPLPLTWITIAAWSDQRDVCE